MEVTPFVVQTLVPPQDDLKAKIRASALTLEEHDVIAIASKVVSIGEGRTVKADGVNTDALIAENSDEYLPKEETPGQFVTHTLTNGNLIPNAGIDPFGGHYVLWPKDPKKSAEELLAWFKETYNKEHLYVVITDSRSVFLRKGVVGMTVAWAGFEPLFDNRMRVDLLGFPSGGSQTNIPDSLAATATYAMGEANESTPLVRIRNAPFITPSSSRSTDFKLSVAEDIFAPFLTKALWKKGKRLSREEA